jgi:hypothetical protein
MAGYLVWLIGKSQQVRKYLPNLTILERLVEFDR